MDGYSTKYEFSTGPDYLQPIGEFFSLADAIADVKNQYNVSYDDSDRAAISLEDPSLRDTKWRLIGEDQNNNKTILQQGSGRI